MDREYVKLIKSFKVIKPISVTMVTSGTVIKTKVGDIITLRKYQGMIGISLLDMYFENPKNNHTFSLRWLVDNIGIHVIVHEKFAKLEHKFEYII